MRTGIDGNTAFFIGRPPPEEYSRLMRDSYARRDAPFPGTHGGQHHYSYSEHGHLVSGTMDALRQLRRQLVFESFTSNNAG